VEPSVAVDPTDPMHLIGAWQQDRWSNGAANGIVSAVTFDGGHHLVGEGCAVHALQRRRVSARDGPVGEHRAGCTAYQITYAFDWDRVNRAMLVSRSATAASPGKARSRFSATGIRIS